MSRDWNPIRWLARRLRGANDVERPAPPAPPAPPDVHTVEVTVRNGETVRARWESFARLRWRGFTTDYGSPMIRMVRLTLNGVDRLEGDRVNMPRELEPGDVVEMWLSLSVSADGLFEVPAKVHFMTSPL